MPKKVIYTKEQIVEKAYELLKVEGLNSITARNLAKSLKTSPAPIYGYFSSMDLLKDELIKKAKEQFLTYVANPYTEMPFLNAGMGFVIFAREEKELFCSIFLMTSSYRDIITEFKELIFEEIDKDPRFININLDKKNWLFEKCWTYAHGFATLVSMGFHKDSSDENIKKNLLDLGIFFSHIFENGN